MGRGARQKCQIWMDFSTIRGSDGNFCSVSTGKALHQYTFKIKVFRNNPASLKSDLKQLAFHVHCLLTSSWLLKLFESQKLS